MTYKDEWWYQFAYYPFTIPGVFLGIWMTWLQIQSSIKLLNRQKLVLKDRTRTILIWLSPFSIASFTCMHVIYLSWQFTDTFIFDVSCQNAMAVVRMGVGSVYILGKLSLYLILLFRTFIAFQTSLYSINLKKWLIWIGCVSFLTISAFIFLFSDKKEIEKVGKDKHGRCQTIVTQSTLIGFSMMALADLLTSISLTILFVRPLFKMHWQSKMNGSINMHSNDLIQIAIRCAILGILTIFTSVFALIIAGITGFNPIIYLDGSISSLGILLCSSDFTGIYKRLCGKCIDIGQNFILPQIELIASARSLSETPQTVQENEMVVVK